MKLRLSSFIFLLSSFALLNTASAQWIIDGKKTLTVHDPAGLRSQIGAVADESGRATNLTVSGTNTLSNSGTPVARFVSLTNGIALYVYKASTTNWVLQNEWTED